ncbi:MAG: hypothetical protein WBZ27_05250, partial [Pseudolabrys sp.]
SQYLGSDKAGVTSSSSADQADPSVSTPPCGGLSVSSASFANVRFWHLADKSAARAFVRYLSNSGHWSALVR